MKCSINYALSGEHRRVDCDNIQTAIEMANDLLNVTQADSVTINRAMEPEPIEIDEARLIRAYRQLTPNNRRMAREIVENFLTIQNQ